VDVSSATRRPLCAIVAAFVFVLALVAPAIAGDADDDFAAGYVTAVLERELEVEPISVVVRRGAAVIELRDTEEIDVERLKALLSGVRVLRKLEVRYVSAPAGQQAQAAEGPEAPSKEPETEQVETASIEHDEAGEEGGTLFLPRGHLFQALLADPRWPRFAVSYQHFFDDAELDDVAAVNLGGEFPIVRWDGPADGRMQLGIQGGIFSIFDLNADSFDLVNADYRIGLPLTYERGRLSMLARLFHQSSHLGDEFLLRNRVERINLSYEAVDLLASYRAWKWMRLYGGGGYLFHQDPSDLQPWWAQTGTEFTWPKLLGGFLRPVAAVDLQFHDENDYSTDLSVRTGVQLESPRLVSQRMYLLLEYYDGRNPNGQFFERAVEYTGIGLHGHF
jgi:hypothetical protein